jgi:hypothetical protein
MLPTDNTEELIGLGMKMARIWKAHESVGMFQSMEEESEWQRDKKKLKILISKVLEDIKEEETDEVSGAGI